MSEFSGPFYKFFFDMNWLNSNGVVMRSDAMIATARGGPRVEKAKIGNGLSLNGQLQYVDGGPITEECLSNIDLCWYGLSLGLWLNVPQIQNGAYLVYTGPNGLSLYMENNALVGRFVANGQQWVMRYPDFKPGKWYFVELTWNKQEGGKMFVDLLEVDSDLRSKSIYNAPNVDNFYLGRSPDAPPVYAKAMMDDVELWYGLRKDLVRTKFILRGKAFWSRQLSAFNVETAHVSVCH